MELIVPLYIRPDYVYEVHVRRGGFVVSRNPYIVYYEDFLYSASISYHFTLDGLVGDIRSRIERGSYGSNKVEGLRDTFKKMYRWKQELAKQNAIHDTL